MFMEEIYNFQKTMCASTNKMDNWIKFKQKMDSWIKFKQKMDNWIIFYTHWSY